MTDLRSFDPYHVFIATAHALRRQAERGSAAMGATYGVAAHPLPFQLATVNRILTDLRIRHLIADEVGLGKTIQAIMVLNALAARDPKHATVIVAPERLLGQWHEELWTRGHILGHIVDEQDRARMSAFREYLAEGTAGTTELPHEDHPASRFADARALLLRPHDVIDQPEWLAPGRHHMLIIDEPQSIPREALGRLQQASNPVLTEEPTFRQLLVLSATPRLGDPVWRDLIFDLIEPERMRLARDAGQEPSEWFEARERNAAARLTELSSADVAVEGKASFHRDACTRRMSRQTRENWGAYFPTRKNKVHRFDPIASECGRLELIDLLLDGEARRSASTLEGHTWTTVRGLLRSRRSVREAIDRMERPPEIAAKVRNDAATDFGDSRFDALTDILSLIFAQDHEPTGTANRPKKGEKVVIVAGDAGTIDMLATVLPRYFPELAEEGIAALRRSSSTSESTFEDMREMHETLRPFTEGNARVLLIGDWIQAGLNLQHSARNMIFYSLPWDPQAIDQLIGRIDRLSHSSISAVHAGRAGAGTIRVWRLVMRHSPEERLSDALDALGVFDRALPQVSEDSWATINRLLVDVMTSAGPRAMTALTHLREMRGGWQDRGFTSLLDRFDPLTVPRIMSETGRVGEIAARFATMSEEERSPADRIELANMDWLHATSRAGGFRLSWRRDQSDTTRRFNSLSYHSRNAALPFHLADLGQSTDSDDSMHFLVHRRHMSVPPARAVMVNAGDGTPRPLQFFDHGAAIHDQLCRGWLDFGLRCLPDFLRNEILVKVGSEHPALTYARRPVLLSVVSREQLVDSPDDIPVALSDMLLRFSESAASTYLAHYREGLEADRRWLMRHLSSQISIRGSVLGDRGWENLDAHSVVPLFRCMPAAADGFRLTSKLQQLRAKVAQQCVEHQSSIQREFDDLRRTSLAAMLPEWRERQMLMEADASDHAGIYENRSKSRALVATSEMAAARRGLVEADLRRADLMRELGHARRTTSEQMIKSALSLRSTNAVHVCMRFINGN